MSAAWHEFRLLLAQYAIELAVWLIPKGAPEMRLLYDMIRKWKDLCQSK